MLKGLETFSADDFRNFLILGLVEGKLKTLTLTARIHVEHSVLIKSKFQLFFKSKSTKAVGTIWKREFYFYKAQLIKQKDETT